jgi:hypothetical protein
MEEKAPWTSPRFADLDHQSEPAGVCYGGESGPFLMEAEWSEVARRVGTGMATS